MKKNKVLTGILVVSIITLLFLAGCLPDCDIDPAIGIDVSISGGPAPLEVSFTGSVIVPAVANTNGWTWNFGDGSNLATGPNVSHTYTQEGKYTVTLSAVVNGKSCTQTQTIEVYAPEPVECPTKITGINYLASGECCMNYIFEASFDGPAPSKYKWTFGDGLLPKSSDLAEPTHRYVYNNVIVTVTLTISDKNGVWSDPYSVSVPINGCCQDSCYTCPTPPPCNSCDSNCLELTRFDTPFKPYETRVVEADILTDCGGCASSCSPCDGCNDCYPCGYYVTWNVYRCGQVANPDEYDLTVLCEDQCRQNKAELSFFKVGTWEVIAILRDKNGREICQDSQEYGVANY